MIAIRRSGRESVPRRLRSSTAGRPGGDHDAPRPESGHIGTPREPRGPCHAEPERRAVRPARRHSLPSREDRLVPVVESLHPAGERRRGRRLHPRDQDASVPRGGDAVISVRLTAALAPHGELAEQLKPPLSRETQPSISTSAKNTPASTQSPGVASEPATASWM